MVEAFDMLVEYDSGMVFEDYKVPMGDDLRSFEEFFYLKRQPLGEFVIVLKEGGLFYFLSDHFCDFTEVCKKYDWYVISHQPFNKQLEIGIGMMNTGGSAGWIGRAESSERLSMYKDILVFSYDCGVETDFYPYDTTFKGYCEIGGSLCYYVHNYYPTRVQKIDGHQKRISNLIFRFKEGGHCGMLVAKIISLCMKNISYCDSPQQTILIPIPASTRERQRKRFPVLCYHLSKWLNVRDGFQTIWIDQEREQMKGISHKEVVSNLRIKKRDVQGMNVILFDDVLTSGQSFRQLRRKMMELGAKSVIGIFLGKTVDLHE